MNKKDVLEKLRKELDFDDDTLKKIGHVFDNNFILGKNNKEKILDALTKEVNIDRSTADKVYNTFMSVIGKGIKDKVLGILKK